MIDLLLLFIFFFAFSIEAATGFGSILIALMLGSFFYPIEELLPLLILMDLIVNLYIFLLHKREIIPIFLKKILFPEILGFLIGLYFVKEGIFFHKKYFALFIFTLGFLGLLEVFTSFSFSLLPPFISFFLSGFTHALYASGGAFLAFGISRLPLSPSSMRSTLAFFWVFLDSFLLFFYLLQGKIPTISLYQGVSIIGVLLGALFLGEYIHKRLSLKGFLRIIYILMVAYGIYFSF